LSCAETASDELDCDDVGTYPKYNILDASFLKKGAVHVVTGRRI